MVSFHANFNDNNIYFFPQLQPAQNCNVITSCELFICYKLSSDFVQGSNIYKILENYTQIRFLSIVIARPKLHCALIREITCIKKIYKYKRLILE